MSAYKCCGGYDEHEVNCILVIKDREIEEQCRLNGMGAERELKLLTQIENFKKQLKIEYIEKCRLQSRINELEEVEFNLKAELKAWEHGL